MPIIAREVAERPTKVEKLVSKLPKSRRISAGNHEAAAAILENPAIAGGCLVLIEWACLFNYRMASLAIKKRPGSIAGTEQAPS